MDSNKDLHDTLDSTHLALKENEVGATLGNSHEDSRPLIDKNVIEFMEGLMGRVRRTAGRSLEDLVTSQTDWYREANPSSPIRLSYDLSRLASDSDELRRAHEMRAILEPSKLLLQTLSNIITLQLEDCTSQITAIHSRAAFSSLPDEILSSVLEFGAYRSPAKMGSKGIAKAESIIASVKAAVQLSSVCSRFRRIVLYTPSMWNQICIGMPLEMLKVCVERAGSIGLDIFFDISVTGLMKPEPREELALPFLEFAMSVVGTWRQFNHHCFTFLLEGNSLPVDEMSQLEVMTNGLHSPRLSELIVRYGGGHRDDFDEGDDLLVDNSRWHKIFHYYSTWTLPGLRSMSTFNTIPIPFSGCSSIETLCITMDYTPGYALLEQRRSFDANGLSNFLASCPVLRKFTLRLTKAKLPLDIRPPTLPNSTSIEDLDLYLDQCRFGSIGHFIDTIRCPFVNSMNLAIRCNKLGSRNFRPSEDIYSIFSNPDVFPRLENLRFDAESGPDHHHSIALPIECIPKLRSLRLHLLGRVELKSLLGEETIHVLPAHLSSIFREGVNFDRSEAWWIEDVWHLLETQGRLDAHPLRIFVKDLDANGGTYFREQSIEEVGKKWRDP
ncbi:hypothetical protein SCHPADRAFT_996880 [Schizopora paradoxa]|uniref:Uncharacterized protein n=1 Tax=Schizopora paradoxa TaxID=27342 RepID=A0A0H2RQE6_9AGAM|nr:hypothetical protein SCHPADRAFT_996880 [Schizopora paradoxa]